MRRLHQIWLERTELLQLIHLNLLCRRFRILTALSHLLRFAIEVLKDTLAILNSLS